MLMPVRNAWFFLRKLECGCLRCESQPQTCSRSRKTPRNGIIQQQQHKQSSSAHHSFFVDDLQQPAFQNCHGVDTQLSDAVHRLCSWCPSGLPVAPSILGSTNSPSSVHYHDMVLLAYTGASDADHHVWTPEYDLCA